MKRADPDLVQRGPELVLDPQLQLDQLELRDTGRALSGLRLTPSGCGCPEAEGGEGPEQPLAGGLVLARGQGRGEQDDQRDQELLHVATLPDGSQRPG